MITLFFANLLGWITAHWKLIAGIVAAAILVVVAFLTYAWLKPQPKIDLDTVDRINRANDSERKKELQDVIEDNQDVIRTVDNRSALNETNVVERNREIDAKVKAANDAIAEAKRQGRDVTEAELKCLLVPTNCQ